MAIAYHTPNNTYVVYGEESAYGTGTPLVTNRIGRVTNVSLTMTNNFFKTQGLGEGRNATGAFTGPFDVSGSIDWDVDDFTFMQYVIGTKEGCGGLGQCGACTVIMDSKAVNSCLVLAMDARDKEILTIEGVATGGKLHPIQQAFLDYGAIQCGFCIPGMVLSAKALLDENHHPTEDEIKTAIAGNLCRCTGYAKNKEALLAVAEQQGKEGKR